MPTMQRYPIPSDVYNSQHVELSKFNSDPSLSQLSDAKQSISRDAATSQVHHSDQHYPLNVLCCVAEEKQQQQGIAHPLEGLSIRDTMLENYSTTNIPSRVRNQLTCHQVRIVRQTSSYTTRYLSEGFQEKPFSIPSPKTTPLPLVLGVRQLTSATNVPNLIPGTTNSALPLQLATEKALLGCVGTNKRRREPDMDLLSQDSEIEHSDGSTRCSKRIKAGCDCETDHSWWMTIKIDELKEAHQQINDVKKLISGSSYQLDKIGDILCLLEKSQGVLESVEEDMRAEGGRDRE